MWTKETIQALINSNDRAVERALVAIYNRQTEDEKQSTQTRHLNHRGFRHNHAVRGSYYARWVNSGRRLTGRHLELGRAIALVYHRQLLDIAIHSEARAQVMTCLAHRG